MLFFDECESLFAQRGRGGSHQLTELLTEIERHKGIIFLATNRPYDLDEVRQLRHFFETLLALYLRSLEIVLGPFSHTPLVSGIPPPVPPHTRRVICPSRCPC